MKLRRPDREPQALDMVDAEDLLAERDAAQRARAQRRQARAATRAERGAARRTTRTQALADAPSNGWRAHAALLQTRWGRGLAVAVGLLAFGTVIGRASCRERV